MSQHYIIPDLNRYRILRKLVEVQYGCVFHVIDTLNKEAREAIKIMKNNYDVSGVYSKRD